MGHFTNAPKEKAVRVLRARAKSNAKNQAKNERKTPW